MPDTGAPWFIPYVAGTDLVSDWPTDSLALANAIDAGLDAANTGIGTNVVQTVKSDTFSTTSGTFTTVTGLEATITPSSASSKVLVIVDLNVAANNSAVLMQGRLVVGGSAIYVGDAASSRTPSAFNSSTLSNINTRQQSIVFLHSPATTSATTYGVEVRVSTGSGSIYVNRSYGDADAASSPRTASSITLIEVAA